MSEVTSKKVATIIPVQKVDEVKEKEEVPEKKITQDSQEEAEESSDEEFVPDEEHDDDDSETEEVKKSEEGDEEKKEQKDIDDEDSCSSGEEEEGVNVDIVELGGQKFFKLKFDDVEQKRKEFKAKIQQEEEEAEESQEQDEEDIEEEQEEATEAASESSENKENLKPSFKEYRTETILDEDMDYKSDEDDNFDPVFCGETLSDVEYVEGEEHDTESEPETEPMEGTHKKTGETLVCIKMIEQLQIPPLNQPCSPNKFSNVNPADQPMECT